MMARDLMAVRRNCMCLAFDLAAVRRELLLGLWALDSVAVRRERLEAMAASDSAAKYLVN